VEHEPFAEMPEEARPVARVKRAGRGSAEVPDRQFVTALARGLNILSCFDATCTQLNGTEIAARLGLPQPTVWRLCRTMTKLGFLSLGPDERFRPNLPVLRLGYNVLAPLDLTELARPYLQELAATVSGAAGLAVRDGRDMRFVERCESESQLLMNLRIGSRVPLATSAMGWAYLAALDEEAREAALAEAAPDPRIWALAERPFRRAMAEAPVRGFIVNAGVFHPGYNTAAIAIRGPDGVPRYALNCGAAASILSTRELETEVGPQLVAFARLLESVA
jgi:DNA-binding IclR family transcriptional regulator